MKALTLILIFCMVILGNPVKAQNNTLPDIDLYTLDGIRTSTSDLNSAETLLVLVFWEKNDRQALSQLQEINDEYLESLKFKNVKVVGICTDLNGSMCDVKPVVYAHNIEFDMYIDKNNAFKRAMSIPDNPFLIMVLDNSAKTGYMSFCPDIAEIINDKIDLQLAAVPAGK